MSFNGNTTHRTELKIELIFINLYITSSKSFLSSLLLKTKIDNKFSTLLKISVQNYTFSVPFYTMLELKRD